MRTHNSLTMTLYPMKLPPLEPPEGMTLRCFQDGDGVLWESIVAEAFKQTFDFDSHMKSNGFVPEHTWFACLFGHPVATASVWYRPELGQNSGYVHMVCAYSAVSGKRLGYWVTLAALHQLKRENCRMVLLHTDDFRLAAIWTYLNLGFRILYDKPGIHERWSIVLDKLGIKGDLREIMSQQSPSPLKK